MEITIEAKRRIYIMLTVFLGSLLGMIFYALADKSHINDMVAAGMTAKELPISVAVVFLIAGAMFGYVLGVRWWQLVYVEKRHWRNKD